MPSCDSVNRLLNSMLSFNFRKHAMKWRHGIPISCQKPQVHHLSTIQVRCVAWSPELIPCVWGVTLYCPPPLANLYTSKPAEASLSSQILCQTAATTLSGFLSTYFILFLEMRLVMMSIIFSIALSHGMLRGARQGSATIYCMYNILQYIVTNKLYWSLQQ